MDNFSFKKHMDMLEDVTVNQDIKLLIILELLHAGDITLRKAKELCEQQGLFSKSWVAIDADATDIFDK